MLPCDMVFERDVALTMRDGTTIYTDVFRPVGEGRHPAIVAWSPYGKEIGGPWAGGLRQTLVGAAGGVWGLSL